MEGKGGGKEKDRRDPLVPHSTPPVANPSPPPKFSILCSRLDQSNVAIRGRERERFIFFSSHDDIFTPSLILNTRKINGGNGCFPIKREKFSRKQEEGLGPFVRLQASLDSWYTKR